MSTGQLVIDIKFAGGEYRGPAESLGQQCSGELVRFPWAGKQKQIIISPDEIIVGEPVKREALISFDELHVSHSERLPRRNKGGKKQCKP